MPKSAPSTTARTFGRGSAARQDAIRKAHTAESANKLAALKARQEGTTTEAQMTRAACSQYLQAAGAFSGHSRDSVEQLRAAVLAHRPVKARLQYLVAGQPVAEAHNRLSGIARASARKGGTRLSAAELRAMLQAAGIADPDGSPWEFTLPNGVAIAAVPRAA